MHINSIDFLRQNLFESEHYWIYVEDHRLDVRHIYRGPFLHQNQRHLLISSIWICASKTTCRDRRCNLPELISCICPCTNLLSWIDRSGPQTFSCLVPSAESNDCVGVNGTLGGMTILGRLNIGFFDSSASSLASRYGCGMKQTELLDFPALISWTASSQNFATSG